MKTVIGLDSDELYREAVHLLGRLDFVGNRPILVLADDLAIAPTMAAAIAAPCPEASREAQVRFERIVAEANRACDDANLTRHRSSVRTTGTPSEVMLRISEEEGADLVAVGSRRRGRLGSAFLGSVGRALAVSGRTSFLIGRSGTATRGNVRAVFATDHSEYADKCLDQLLDLDPVGLTDIHLVFATDLELGMLRSAAGVFDDADTTVDELRKAIKAKGEALVTKCLEYGRNADYRIADDYAIDGLRSAMYETKSDLLILGARGHGLLERLMIGSLSLHAIVAEPFSVLVLRLPQEEDR